MDNTSFVILPVEKVREMIEIAVSGCLDKVLLTSSLFETQKQSYLIFNKIQYLKGDLG
ncbi:hypothetical protein [Bacteroides acidifaciens]|uniref:hypothetical protein n=1 Tax=Bacteroides acidifaciens TaxID=85831 RepID=UPI0025AA014B|nr:hypothetical protein [Bacteroides acidifaciens]